MASKISLLIIEKSQDLAKQLIPKMIDIAVKAGIERFGDPTELLPDTCLILDKLKPLLELRNQIVNKLNTTADTVNVLAKPIDPLTTTIDTTEETLKKTKTARIIANSALILIPSPPGTPGSVISTINSLKDLEEVLSPIITFAKGNVFSLKNAVDVFNNIAVKIINLLKSIDEYLVGCGISSNDLTPLNDYLQNVMVTKSQVSPSNIYQGFVLEIEKVPYSPTVDRRRAIAKNNNGIILLATPLSFTTLDQVLIEELKLIIDSNNLKAD